MPYRNELMERPEVADNNELLLPTRESPSFPSRSVGKNMEYAIVAVVIRRGRAAMTTMAR